MFSTEDLVEKRDCLISGSEKDLCSVVSDKSKPSETSYKFGGIPRTD